MEQNRIEKLKYFYFKYSGFLLVYFIILIYVFSYNFAVESYRTKNIFICIYFLITAILLFGIYKSKGEVPNLIALLILPLLMLPMLANPILLIPLIGLFILYFRFRKWRVIYIIAVILFVILYIAVYIIAGFLSLVVAYFSLWGVVNDTQKIQSPNGEYVLIIREIDQGALGGDVYVLVDYNNHRKSFLGIVKRGKDIKSLYSGSWGDIPKISWIDNETVMINDRKFNIFNFEKWNN